MTIHGYTSDPEYVLCRGIMQFMTGSRYEDKKIQFDDAGKVVRDGYSAPVRPRISTLNLYQDCLG